MYDQRCLGTRIIDRINHKIKTTWRNQLRHILGTDKFFNTMYLTQRINLRDALSQRHNLSLTQVIGQGMKLAIDIGFSKMIQIDHGNAANRTTRQRLYCPATNTTDADHTDMRGTKTRQPRRAVQAGDTRKATIYIQTDISM